MIVSNMRISRSTTALVTSLFVMSAACGEVVETEGDKSPYADEVVSFEPGDGAGFGSDEFPEVVLGPPDGKGTNSGSLDVLSLGLDGEIVLGFGDREIVDGEGVDFIVFENAFWHGGDADKVFAELGEVAVSQDGEEWVSFACDHETSDAPPFEGCAGWSPTLEYDPQQVVPLDIEYTGGDGFDLASIGVERARYVRIRDVWGVGDTPLRGFDLDAVGIVNFED